MISPVFRVNPTATRGSFGYGQAYGRADNN
jgi:hypothetical protein